ncbi:MAG: hypothetical protein GY953_40700, partial [bacterium]|nr:hypothetical protein [bacterium]
LERSVWARITNHPNMEEGCVWSPAADRIAFMSDRNGGYDMFLRAADGRGDAVPLLTHAHPDVATDWSADGRNVIFYRVDPIRQRDLWRLERKSGGARSEEHPVLTTEHNERAGVLSPDGQWLAYVSDRSGRDEVYVRSFPEGDREVRASADGGNQPRWSRDGTELFYVEGETLTAVPMTTEPALTAGNAEKLFSEPSLAQSVPGVRRYDVGLDGKRFIVVTPVAEAGESPATIRVVQNWFEEFRERQRGQER